MNYQSKILGVGSYLPPNKITNHDLEKIMDTSDEWIRQRSGIETRFWAPDDMGTVDLAEKASLEAISNAGISKEDIDLIITASISNDADFPAQVVSYSIGLAYLVSQHWILDSNVVVTFTPQLWRTSSFVQELIKISSLWEQSFNLREWISRQGEEMLLFFLVTVRERWYYREPLRAKTWGSSTTYIPMDDLPKSYGLLLQEVLQEDLIELMLSRLVGVITYPT